MVPYDQYESLSPKVNSFLWAVDRIGAVFAAPFKGWRKLFPPPDVQPKKILLLRCDGIGDLICSIPAIRALRDNYPDAKMDLMVGKWNKPVAEMIPFVDNIIPRAPWGYRRLRTVRQAGGPTDDFCFAFYMRQEKYDLAIDLRSDLLSLLPLAFWGIPRRVGRATRGGGFAVTDLVPPVGNIPLHEIDRTLEVIRTIGILTKDRSLELNIPDDSINEAKYALRTHDFSPEGTIVFAPGAQWKWKQWPNERFAEVGRFLVDKGYNVAVLGAKTDKEMCSDIVNQIGQGAANLAGKLDLKGAAAAFRICKAILAVDSGPVHIAAAAGAKGVALYGSTLSDQFGPGGDSIKVIQETCDIYPCYQRGDCARPEQWCMGRITAETVKNKLTVVLDKH